MNPRRRRHYSLIVLLVLELPDSRRSAALNKSPGNILVPPPFSVVAGFSFSFSISFSFPFPLPLPYIQPGSVG